MCDSSFSADFFNNVAAVAVVLIFTKVLTHRSRKAKNAANDTPLLSQLHVGAVVLAVVAVGISLLNTANQRLRGRRTWVLQLLKHLPAYSANLLACILVAFFYLSAMVWTPILL